MDTKRKRKRGDGSSKPNEEPSVDNDVLIFDWNDIPFVEGPVQSNVEIITFDMLDSEPHATQTLSSANTVSLNDPNYGKDSTESENVSPNVNLILSASATDPPPNDPDYIPEQNDSISENIPRSIAPTSTISDSDPDDPACAIISDPNISLENIPEVTRKRQKRAVVETWEKSHIKELRMLGKQYKGYSRTKVGEKYVVKKCKGERSERKIGPSCNSVVCSKNGKRKCNEISDIDRQQAFSKFWKMSWDQKEMYVGSLVSFTAPAKKSKHSRRQGTFKYFLNCNDERQPVCKKFFLNTLGLNEWMVQNWAKKHSHFASSDLEVDIDQRNPGIEYEVDDPAPSKRCKVGRPRSTDIANERLTDLKTFLEELPKLPSHYCRKDSQKLYLEPVFTSKADVYKQYKDKMLTENKQFFATCTFYKMFDEMNLSIHTPKKDQCDICSQHKVGNLSDAVWNDHIRRKARARTEKENDTKRALKGEIYCLTVDLQAVKNSPMLNASAIYYKTKLCVHNYTVYNLSNHHCVNYWWNESEGELNASIFATCLTDYLSNNCLGKDIPIVIYSDGCNFQNRNVVMSNALLHFAVNNNVEVTQKYLVKGHTQMEVDSVHALIERKLKHKEIYLPFDYCQAAIEARKTPFPYETKYMTFEFFRDFSNIVYYNSIRPGRNTGDPTVIDISALRYLPSGKIETKLDFDQQFEDLPRRPRPIDKSTVPKHMYSHRLPIPLRKWQHLQELKAVIPKDFHSFYDNLPHA